MFRPGERYLKRSLWRNKVATVAGRTPRARRQARNRPAALALRALLLTCISACQEASGPPVAFRLGQTIPLGEWNVRVRQPEVVSPTIVTGFHDLRRSNVKSKVVAVHLV